MGGKNLKITGYSCYRYTGRTLSDEAEQDAGVCLKATLHPFAAGPIPTPQPPSPVVVPTEWHIYIYIYSSQRPEFPSFLDHGRRENQSGISRKAEDQKQPKGRTFTRRSLQNSFALTGPESASERSVLFGLQQGITQTH